VLFYAFAMALLGAGGDAASQLLAQHGLLQVGLTPYRNRYMLVGVVLGGGGGWLFYRTDALRRVVGGVLLVLVLTVCTVRYLQGSPIDGSFILFGVATGILGSFLLQRRHKHPETMMVALAVLTAWTVSLSIGYNSPALWIRCLGRCLARPVTQ
jgi:hypothetical protein